MDRSLHIQLSEEGADDERLDTLTKYLRQELLELDVSDVRPATSGEAPEGSRGLDVMSVGGLVVSWLSSDALRTVITTVRNWLSRGPSESNTVRLWVDGDVLELYAASTADQEKLIDMFVSRHSDRKDQPWAANDGP